MGKFQNIKNHRENQRNQNNQRGQGKNYQKPSGEPNKPKHQNFQTHVHFGRHGSESFFFVLLLFSRWFLIVFALTSLVVLVSLVFPMVFDIFKCTLDSSKRLGRRCAPLLNKIFTLHEFPYIRGFLV